MGQKAQREDRLADSPFVPQEDREHHRAGHQGDEGAWVGPTDGAGLDEAEDDGAHAKRARERAEQVEMALQATGLGEHTPPEDPDRDTNGDVDEHDPAPRHPLREQPSHHEAGGSASGRHGRIEADGAHVGRALREGGGQEGQGGGRGECCAKALYSPSAEQGPAAQRQAADEGGRGEDANAEEEHTPATEEIAGPCAEKEKPAEGEDVRVEHPRQGAGGEPQAVLDVRERDVDDGRVQHDHQLRGQDHREQHCRLAQAARLSRSSGPTWENRSRRRSAAFLWARQGKGGLRH